MHICYLVETLALIGGYERVITRKATWLAEHGGHEVTVVEVYRPMVCSRPVDAHCLSPGVRRVALGLTKRPHRWQKAWQMREVVRAVERAVAAVRPDVVCGGGLLGLVALGLGRYACRTVFESHTPRHTLPLPPLIRLLERRIAAVVALTEGDAREWRHARRVVVIPNAAPPAPTGGEEAADEGNPTPPLGGAGEGLFLFLGRLASEKDPALLLDAWRIVADEAPAARLDIYGDGPLRPDIVRRIAALGLGGSVALHAARRDTASLYKEATALVLTSRYEGFGMVILEALALGVPVVATDCRYGPREILTAGGLLVERRPEAVAAAVVSLANDEALLRRLRREAPRVAARYAEPRIMGLWQEFFASL